MGSNVNLGSFEVTEATVSRSVSRSSSYFAYNKIFDKIYACNLVLGLELAFPYLFCQKSCDRMFLRFLPIRLKKKKNSVSQSCRPHLFFCAQLILQNSDFHFFS